MERFLYTIEVWVVDHWQVPDEILVIGMDREQVVQRMHVLKKRDTSKNFRVIALIEEV